MNNNEYVGDDAEADDLAARTLRPPLRINCEDIIAQELAGSNLTDPVNKIRHVCESLFSLNKSERARARISEDDMAMGINLHKIAIAIQGAYIHTLQDRFGRSSELYAAVAWPFPRSDATNMLGWLKDVHVDYYTGGEPADRKWADMIKTLKFPEDVYEITSARTTMESYRRVSACFVGYAMLPAVLLRKKIMGLISPDSYQQALQMLRRSKDG